MTPIATLLATRRFRPLWAPPCFALPRLLQLRRPWVVDTVCEAWGEACLALDLRGGEESGERALVCESVK